MRLVVQRVLQAEVQVDGQSIGKIGRGFLVLVGVGKDDTKEIADKYLKKLLGLRIFEDENGKTKRKSVTAKTKSECQEKLNKTKEEYLKEQSVLSSHTYLTDSDPTLNEWYEIWINTFCKNVIKDYTVNGYEQRFKTNILPALGDMKLSELSTVNCQQFLVGLFSDGRQRGREKHGNGLAYYSVKGIERTLSSCLQKAVDEDLIPKNPLSKVKLPNCAKPEMKTLKKEELTAFLEEAKRSGCYEFYYLELTTGMRLGEICALEWDDLSLENKTITVNKAVQKIKGEVKINTPKTKSSIRTIRLCDECIRLLSELKANQIPKSKYIFPSSVTGEIRDTSAVTRRLHRIQDRAGVPKIRFHDLRHSFATLSLEQGMDIKTVSHMLGHTDAGFTMNTYMHVTDSMQENVANTMGNLLGGNATNS